MRSAVVIGSLALAACATPDIAARAAGAQPLASTDEAGLWLEMGRAEEELRRSPSLNQDAELNAYVHDVVCRVSAEYCADLRVYVMDAPYLNAAMAPNGMMQVWSGLLLRAENEAQLAFVIGHETVHYVENHSLESWRAAKSGTATGAAVGVLLGADMAAFGLLGLFSFSREQERQADQLGFERTVAAGYDPAQAAAIWRLVTEETARSDSEEKRKAEARGGFFSTHPLNAERLASLEAQAQGLPGGTVNADRHADVIAPHLGAWLEADLQRRDYGESLFLIERLAARGRDLGVVKFYEGEAYRLRAQEGDAALARSAYLAAAAYPDAPAATWRQIGEIMRAEGDNAQAIVAFEDYLARAPEAVDRLIIESYLTSLRGSP
jgi:predicted Zn-dependent protease